MIDLPFHIDPGIEMSVATQGMSKGILQSKEPQIIPRVTAKAGRVNFAAQWKNVDSSLGTGEASASIAYAIPFKPVDLSISVNRKVLTGHGAPGDSKSWEFGGSMQRKFGRAVLRVAAIWSPDDLGTAGQSLYLEGGPSVDLGKGWRVSAAAGRRTREAGQGYHAFNVGVAKSVGKNLTAEARYFTTDQSSLGEVYRDRVVGVIKFSF